MKTILRNGSLLASLWAAAILTVVSLSPTMGLGQEPPSDDPFAGKPVRTFDIDFPGGTLEEFAGLVMSLQGDVSITIPTQAKAASVPNMSFKKINFSDLTELVHAATQRTKNEIRFIEATPGRWVGHANIREEPRELAIFPAERLLRKNSVDDIIAVVGKAFNVAGKRDVPQFHLHKETSVLMASLTKSEMEIVERLIAALEIPVPDGEKEREEKRKIVEKEIAEQRARFQKLSMEHAKMTAAASRLNDENELVKHNVRIQMLKAEQRLLENELASYMQLLTRLRAAELGVGDEFETQPIERTKPGPVQN